MMSSNFDDLIRSIQRLMYGHNYEVCLGIDIFNGVTNTDFEKSIKEKYPETNPNLYPLIQSDIEEFINDVKDKLSYRGDYAAGLTLTYDEEIKLQELQQKYIDYVEQFFGGGTKVFYYSDPDGIPGYPVFWEYRYVLFTEKNKIIFVYGSSSD